MPLLILENQSLQPFNTFGFDVSARYFVEVNTVEQIGEALQFAADRSLPLLVLGEGSNLVLAEDIPELVVKLAIAGIEVVEENQEHVLVRAAAGENWHGFVQWCLEQGYYGLENLSLIPGTVGAAPVQNIGAYGVELKDVFRYLEAIDRTTGKTVTLNQNACCFSYRESIFKGASKNRYIITHVVFSLTKQASINTSYGAIAAEIKRLELAESPLAVSEAVCSLRRSKLPDPAELGNAGSFFKNPVINNEQFSTLLMSFPDIVSYPAGAGSTKLAAGWLIDQCGWKGYREGQIGVHVHQALVLVNYGGGSAADLLALAERIRDSVRNRFGVELEMEPGIYPTPGRTG